MAISLRCFFPVAGKQLVRATKIFEIAAVIKLESCTRSIVKGTAAGLQFYITLLKVYNPLPIPKQGLY
jgi:hypothetical protein